MNTRGMTLVEVLLAVAISVIGVSVFMFFALSSRNHAAQIDRSIVLKQILTDNAIELKGLQITDLAPIGKCLVRLYKIDRSFVSETTIDVGNGKCPSPSLEANQIQVAWQMEPTSSIDATFSSPNLKLPKYSDTLRKVSLHAWGYGDAKGSNLLHSEIVIFKR